MTLEENAVAGGAGAAVNELLAREKPIATVLNLGLPDQFLEHGSHQEQLRCAGLESGSILHSINQFVQTPDEQAWTEVHIRDAVEMPR